MKETAGTQPKKIGVVIVSYNVKNYLKQALTAVVKRSQKEPDVEVDIWVVDNASSDGSPEMVREEFPMARLLEPGKNLGFAAGNNFALREMGFPDGNPDLDYVFLLNPDALVNSGALTTLVMFMERHPDAGMVGPYLYYSDGLFQHSAFRFPDWKQVFLDLFPINWRLQESRLNGRYPRRMYKSGKPFKVDFILGAAMMVRPKAIEQVGLFDEGYFMYVEEVDWCRRMREAGWEIYVDPRAGVLHFGGRSTKQFLGKMYVALWKSRLRYFEKYHGKAYNELVRGIVLLGMGYQSKRAQAMAKKGEISPEELKERLEAYRKVEELARV